MKSKSTAAILAFFLGGLGVHRFYLGQTGLGFLYLIFCWTLIPAFAGFIDFVLFLIMSDQAFNEKYNKHLGVYPHALTQSLSNNINISNGNSESDLDKLEKLGKLRDAGVISEVEFEKRKLKILED
jgi:TM2 domain-containing membrane protein YozV